METKLINETEYGRLLLYFRYLSDMGERYTEPLKIQTQADGYYLQVPTIRFVDEYNKQINRFDILPSSNRPIESTHFGACPHQKYKYVGEPYFYVLISEEEFSSLKVNYKIEIE